MAYSEGKNRAIRTLQELKGTLEKLVAKEPRAHAESVAITTVDAVIADARQYVDAEDPVLKQIQDVISPEAVETGDWIFCSDLLLVVSALLGRIGPRDMPRPRVVARAPRRRI